jgi:hypothetical protein
MTRGCNKVDCRSIYINLIRSSIQAGVEHLYIFRVSLSIYDGGYKPTNMESVLDKVQIVP